MLDTPFMPQSRGLAFDKQCIQYVLDTNVLLHDPAALFSFQEHNIYLPQIVLEELDKHKKGFEDIARNARQVTRTLDAALTSGSLVDGFSLAQASDGKATGRLFFVQAPVVGSTDFELKKADNLILACAQHLMTKGATVLVTKDINLRVKALASGVSAQDYRNDRVLTDEDVLPVGFIEMTDNFWLTYLADQANSVYRKGGRDYVNLCKPLPINSFVIERKEKGKIRLWRVADSTDTSSIMYAMKHQSVVGDVPLLTARNEHQQLALNLLHDPEIDFVALLGNAGTGKTLLAVAAGLELVKQGKFKEILITRATVPMGEEIGFLPGTEEDKMSAWLGGTLRDCFSVLNLTDEKNPLRKSIEIASMSFMRGRSFQGKFIIIDEAQNLTQKQIRSLLTRAGEGSKVIVTGNLAQIDTPYLDEASSGLAWAVKHFQNWMHAGHLILPKGERSRLATYVEEHNSRVNVNGAIPTELS